MIKLPFTEDCIQELMTDQNMTRTELTEDYNYHLNLEESHDGEFTNDWTKTEQ